MSTVELIGVSKRYRDVTAVDITDLKIEEGELVTLLGPSGSGKSTILSMIAGLTTPSSGHIKIGGRDVTHVPPPQRHLGVVFQSYALFPHMSVFDNMAFSLTIRGLRKTGIAQRVSKALEQVRLTGLQDRRSSQLSGGQQQRVALAPALVFEPDILLLDEPMGALDRKLREEVRLELRQLQRELGVTTLLVTHDQEEALSLSTRLVVRNQGQVQQVDTPLGAYRRPCNRFVAGFIGTASVFEGQVAAGAGGATIELPGGESVRCTPDHGVSGPASLIVRPEHLKILDTDTATGLPARVVEVVYFGQSVRVHMKTDAGVLVVAISDGLQDLPAPDQAVGLDWAPEHTGSWRHEPAARSGGVPTTHTISAGSALMRSIISPIAWLVVPLLLVMAVGFNLPLILMLGQSFVGPDGFTLAHFHEVFAASVYIEVLGNTFRIALIAAGTCMLVGYPLAYWLRRLPQRWQMVALPLIVNAPQVDEIAALIGDTLAAFEKQLG